MGHTMRKEVFEHRETVKTQIILLDTQVNRMAVSNMNITFSTII